MQPRLLVKSSQKAEFVPAEWSGINASGYQPIGDHVMVMMDKASETTGGGIDLIPEMIERMTLAAETGVIVAVGGDAFLWISDRTRRWEGDKPGPGTRVYVQRYAGQVVLGEDGAFYRVMSDTCIAAMKTS